MSNGPSSAWMGREFSPSHMLWRNLVFPHMRPLKDAAGEGVAQHGPKGHPRLVQPVLVVDVKREPICSMRAAPSCSIGRPRCARRRDGAIRCGVARTQPLLAELLP